MSPTSILALLFLLLAIVIVVKGVRIVRQSESMVIERLGKYRTTLNAGINIIIPIVDRPRDIVWRLAGEMPDGTKVVQYKLRDRVDLRETVFDFPKQGVITKDNVVTEINALIYFQITDAVKAVYEINNLPNAIEKLTQTTLRNVIGELELDECLTSRDTINMKLRTILDEATNKWGTVKSKIVYLRIGDEERKALREEAERVGGEEPEAEAHDQGAVGDVVLEYVPRVGDVVELKGAADGGRGGKSPGKSPAGRSRPPGAEPRATPGGGEPRAEPEGGCADAPTTAPTAAPASPGRRSAAPRRSPRQAWHRCRR